MIEHFAHSHKDWPQEDWEPVIEHLQFVAKRAAEFGAVFGAKEECEFAGLLHDIGKYGQLFQKRIRGKESQIDHWSLGAWAAFSLAKKKGFATAFAIQGHHLGLQTASMDAMRALHPPKLQNPTCHPLGLKLSASDEVEVLAALEGDGGGVPKLQKTIYDYRAMTEEACTAAAMLDLRMLFSTLVDADYLETEAFMTAKAPRTRRYRLPSLPLKEIVALAELKRHIDHLRIKSTASLNVLGVRDDLLNACETASMQVPGIFTLTAPTGSGKTLAMLAFALNHAAQKELRRIVVVIPYLTIIEQTAKEYRRIFKDLIPEEDLNRYILEHHSLSETHARDDRHNEDPDEQDESRSRPRLLAENWDAPIIITTSVQLLESLFSNRPSACRKLHRLAQSVILFDEVQTLPLGLVVPTLATLSQLSQRYGSTVVFSTATQPAFRHLDKHVECFCQAGWKPEEIVKDNPHMFQTLKRTLVKWPDTLDKGVSWTELTRQMAKTRQFLCIVNLKRHAVELMQAMKPYEEDGLLHLSTNMCPAHREKVLDEVRSRLTVAAPCRLISTQCIEAGVDVDFPVVYRAFGPLDSIAQASGRCNRNGILTEGVVHVFIPEDEGYPSGEYQRAAQVAKCMLREKISAGMQLDINEPDVFQKYFEQLYDLAQPEGQKAELIEAIRGQNFVETSKYYRLIEKDTINLLVSYDKIIFAELAQAVRACGLTSKWIQDARPYVVSVFRPSADVVLFQCLESIMVGKGRKTVSADDWFIYHGKYDPQIGLIPESASVWIG